MTITLLIGISCFLLLLGALTPWVNPLFRRPKTDSGDDDTPVPEDTLPGISIYPIIFLTSVTHH